MIVLQIIIILTAVLVYLDARRLGLKKGVSSSKLDDLGPIAWAVVCLFLWIISLPMYLIRRHSFIQTLSERGELRNPAWRFFAPIMWTLFAVGLLALTPGFQKQASAGSVVSASLAPSQNNRVAGFKDINFDITLEELKAMHKCDLRPMPVPNMPSVYGFSCSNFKIGNDEDSLLFYFVNDKLQRIAIVTSATVPNVKAYMATLSETYVKSLPEPSRQDVDAFDRFELSKLDFNFADGSVILRLAHLQNSAVLYVIYDSGRLEDSVTSTKTDGLKGSL